MLLGLKKVRKANGKTQAQVAEDLGVELPTYRTWEQCRNSPQGGTANQLADYFDVTTDELFGRTPLPPNAFRAVAGRVATAPLYGKIAAGQAIEMNEACERLQLPPEVADEYPNGFFLEVTGDSMNSIILDGGYALIDPSKTIHNGDIVAVNINGYDATLKRYSKTGGKIILLPDSSEPSHEPITVEDENARVLGKMVWMTYPARFRY